MALRQRSRLAAEVCSKCLYQAQKKQQIQQTIHIYIHIHIFIYTYIYTYIYIYIYTHTHTYIYIYKYTYIYIYVSIRCNTCAGIVAVPLSDEALFVKWLFVSTKGLQLRSAANSCTRQITNNTHICYNTCSVIMYCSRTFCPGALVCLRVKSRSCKTQNQL